MSASEYIKKLVQEVLDNPDSPLTNIEKLCKCEGFADCVLNLQLISESDHLILIERFDKMKQDEKQRAREMGFIN